MYVGTNKNWRIKKSKFESMSHLFVILLPIYTTKVTHVYAGINILCKFYIIMFVAQRKKSWWQLCCACLSIITLCGNKYFLWADNLGLFCLQALGGGGFGGGQSVNLVSSTGIKAGEGLRGWKVQSSVGVHLRPPSGSKAGGQGGGAPGISDVLSTTVMLHYIDNQSETLNHSR